MASFKGKTKMKESLAEDRRALKNEMKIYVEDDKSKTLVAKALDVSNRRIARKPLMGIRKSVPSNVILKQHGNDENTVKTGGKSDISVEYKGGRKALADVSNVRGYSLRGQTNSSGSKSMVRVLTSTRKPVLDRTKVNDSQKTKERNAHDSVSSKRDDSSDHSSHQKSIDDRTHTILDANDGKTASKPPLAARKSAASLRIYRASSLCPSTSLKTKGPCSKLGSLKVNTESPMKTNVKNLEKQMEKPSISGIKTRRKALVEISSIRSHLRRNQNSNGSELLTTNGRSLSHRRFPSTSQKAKVTSSRKPTMTMSGHTGPKAGRAMKSKVAPCLEKKSMTRTVNSSIEGEVMNGSTVEKIKPVIPHELNTEKLPTDSSGSSIQSVTAIISKPKSRRRRSYTSSLMARSKVLGDSAGVIRQDELPNIDDSSNPLEVADYVDGIYQFYWFTEAKNPSLANYMVIQTEINSRMRGILVNWLIEVHLKFELMQETLFLMVELLDRYLSTVIIKKNEMQLVGLTALLLASKYEDFWHPKVKDLINISSDLYTRDQMLHMEKLILKKLMFRLNAPTPYVFMLRFLKASQADKKLEHLAFYFIELCLVEYESLQFKPSLLCAAAIYLARCTLQVTPVWTELLVKHSHYEELQLRTCAEMILRFHKAAGRGLLTIAYEKYSGTDRSCVSKIKPIEKLPL